MGIMDNVNADSAKDLAGKGYDAQSEKVDGAIDAAGNKTWYFHDGGGRLTFDYDTRAERTGIARLLGVGLLTGLAGLGGLWFVWGRDLPNVSDLDVLEYSGQTRVYDRSGALVGTLTPSLSSHRAGDRTSINS